jgi:hypothetical protein
MPSFDFKATVLPIFRTFAGSAGMLLFAATSSKPSATW